MNKVAKKKVYYSFQGQYTGELTQKNNKNC